MTFNWYLRRLSLMPFPEKLLRTWRYATRPFTHRRIAGIDDLPHSVDEIVARSALLPGRYVRDDTYDHISPSYAAAVCAQADAVCAGKITLFGETYEVDSPPDWYCDYHTGTRCPRVPYTQVNYRHPEEVGTIMYTWWLNRHQHLTSVALAYYITGEERYAEEVCAQISSWCAASPFPYGPGWMTGIEVGVRLLTWSWQYRFLMARGRPAACTDAFLTTWFTSIRQHMAYIDAYWSRYSSANNHIIAEAAGMCAALCTWSGLCPDSSLHGRARRYLAYECARQISADGVHQEMALSYHAFVLELLVSVTALDAELEDICGHDIQHMSAFLRGVTEGVVEPPSFGDADEAVATGILSRGQQYYHHVANAAHAHDATMTARDTQVTSPMYWYCGKNALPQDCVLSGDFADGGAVVWRTRIDAHDVMLCMQTGGLGLPPLCAHGHADALSLTLHVNGLPVLVDPGTYTYHNAPEWRDYFRSTSAHNTMRINGKDQSVMAGPFMWYGQYETKVRHAVATHDVLDVIARHDGYVDRFNVNHRRSVVWHPTLQKILIQDELIGNGTFEIELFFHVHPGCRVTLVDSFCAQIESDGFVCELRFSTHLKLRIVCGEEDPPMGWYSARLGHKEPCPVIIAHGPVIGSDNIFTECIVRDRT